MVEGPRIWWNRTEPDLYRPESVRIGLIPAWNRREPAWTGPEPAEMDWTGRNGLNRPKWTRIGLNGGVWVRFGHWWDREPPVIREPPREIWQPPRATERDLTATGDLREIREPPVIWERSERDLTATSEAWWCRDHQEEPREPPTTTTHQQQPQTSKKQERLPRTTTENHTVENHALIPCWFICGNSLCYYSSLSEVFYIDVQ